MKNKRELSQQQSEQILFYTIVGMSFVTILSWIITIITVLSKIQ